MVFIKLASQYIQFHNSYVYSLTGGAANHSSDDFRDSSRPGCSYAITVLHRQITEGQIAVESNHLSQYHFDSFILYFDWSIRRLAWFANP